MSRNRSFVGRKNPSRVFSETRLTRWCWDRSSLIDPLDRPAGLRSRHVRDCRRSWCPPRAFLMNVLHVVASLGLRRGGVAASVRSLAQELARLGMGVHIMTADRMREPSVDDSADAELRTSGVTLQYYPVSSSNWLGQRYAYSPALGKALARIIPTMDIVHLHGMWQYPALAAARVCRRAGIPYVLSPCGMLDPTGFRRHRVFKHLYGVSVERRTLAGAAAIHFTSTFEQRVAHLFGIHRPGMVVPCSIEAEPELLPPLGTFRRRYPAIG